jgi:hypothetical protein
VLTVKWGVVRLLYREADLCEQMKEVDKECPLEKGVTTITKDVDLPAQIPPVRLYSKLFQGNTVAYT